MLETVPANLDVLPDALADGHVETMAGLFVHVGNTALAHGVDTPADDVVGHIGDEIVGEDLEAEDSNVHREVYFGQTFSIGVGLTY